MGKRSNFEKITKDFYPSIDPNAIPSSFQSMIYGKRYAEPCYGEGDLENLIGDSATCLWTSDIEERKFGVTIADAEDLNKEDVKDCDLIITNPPYTWSMLKPLLDHLPILKPTWLLLPADFMHNKQSKPYMDNCAFVISVGRLYWFLNKWVVDKEVYADDLTVQELAKCRPVNHQNGRTEYTGWWDESKDKPAKSKFTRGTDNYAWFRFHEKWDKGTVFIGRE